MKDRPHARTTLREHDGHQDERTLLAIYLNDHLAGTTAGVALGRHLAQAERWEPHGISVALDQLAEEIAQDRATLLDIMCTLSVPVRHYKVGAGWVGERSRG